VKPINDKNYIKFTAAGSTQILANHFIRVLRHTDSTSGNYIVDSMFMRNRFRYEDNKYSASFFINHKFNSRHSLRAGVITDVYQFNYLDSAINENTAKWTTRWNYQGFHLLLQPYVQWKFNVTNKFSVNAGLHGQWFTLNNSWSIEPRAAARWQISPQHTLSFGAGLHSQMQPTYIYLMNDFAGSGRKYNIDLGFNRAFHAVVSYDYFILQDLRMKVEAYYQYLYDLPVDTFKSSYCTVNEGNSFDRFFPGKLVNKGIGRNYGLEVTLEKFFTHNWFLMFSGSLFDSKYKSSDGLWHNSDFNNHWILNALGTKEFKWGKKRNNVFGIGGKLTYAGGRLYTPYDLYKSQFTEDPVVIDSLRNMQHFKNYFRLDIKLNYRIETKHGISHEIGIDLVNVTFTKNLLRYQYVGGANPIKEVYQLGFLPLFYYRLDFSIKAKDRPTPAG
jgi:hypothetical protein